MAFEPHPLALNVIGEDLLALSMTDFYQPENSPWAVLAYRFDVVVDAVCAGTISLRIGDTDLVRRLAGHVGFVIDPPFRGNGYAAQAARLILPLASAHALGPLWLTCAPDNTASIRTIEKLGATYVETVDVPETYDSYVRGERQKRRYRLDIE